MDKPKVFSFAIKDNVLGEDLKPDNLTLPLLSEFVDQVMTFLRGSDRPNLNEVKACIKEGSLAVVAEDETGVLGKAYDDYKAMRNGSLDILDPARAKVVEMWQIEAKKNKDRLYQLFVGDVSEDNAQPITISNKTDFKTHADIWIDVEIYLYGRIYDLGGKSKPNVHIELENGKSIKIGTKTSLLSGDNENRLYKDQLVRVKAKENIKTKELKDEQLVSFEYYNPVYDEEQFKRVAQKTRLAWKSIDNPTAWVEELRGNYA